MILMISLIMCGVRNSRELIAQKGKIYENVWEWLKDVIDTMIEFELMEEQYEKY